MRTTQPPATVAVYVGDLWEDTAGQRRFKVLAVTDTRVRVETITGRTAGRTQTIARIRMRPGQGYRRIRTGPGGA